MLIDLLIIILLVSIIVRARQTGLVRQLGAALGFLGGLAVGSFLQPQAMAYANTTLSRALLSLFVTLGCAFVFMNLGELLGTYLKSRLQKLMPLDKADGILGSVAGAVTLLVAVWLVTPILTGLPFMGLQQSLKQSAIVTKLSQRLPSAPEFISRIDKIINPNGFPDVFDGLERRPLAPDTPLPELGGLQPAVEKARPSVVKLEGRGCGGVVEGSGFVADDGVIITNAHVVAGVTKPVVVDNNGDHDATVIGFDPGLDVAVLRVGDPSRLAGQPLTISTATYPNSTPGVVLGYPGGGGFKASPSTVLDQFTARGRDIYGRDLTSRSIYELRADIIPGNSGGPLIDKDGNVIGLVFAESTTYDDVGYALTIKAVAADLSSAVQRDAPVGTGSCAE